MTYNPKWGFTFGFLINCRTSSSSFFMSLDSFTSRQITFLNKLVLNIFKTFLRQKMGAWKKVKKTLRKCKRNVRGWLKSEEGKLRGLLFKAFLFSTMFVKILERSEESQKVWGFYTYLGEMKIIAIIQKEVTCTGSLHSYNQCMLRYFAKHQKHI